MSFAVKHMYLILKHRADTAILSLVRANGYNSICKNNVFKKKDITSLLSTF